MDQTVGLARLGGQSSGLPLWRSGGPVDRSPMPLVSVATSQHAYGTLTASDVTVLAWVRIARQSHDMMFSQLRAEGGAAATPEWLIQILQSRVVLASAASFIALSGSKAITLRQPSQFQSLQFPTSYTTDARLCMPRPYDAITSKPIGCPRPSEAW